LTRVADAGEVSALPQGTKFAIRMFYDNRTTTSTDTEFNSSEESYMKVDDAVGTCHFTNSAYNAASETASGVTRFYWNNRKYHAFVAYTELSDDAPKIASGFNNFTMSEQKDPLLALVKKRPEGGTNEANKVVLTFEHQFAKVEINVKPDGTSVGAEGETVEIQSVILTGVAETSRVYMSYESSGQHSSTVAFSDTTHYAMSPIITPTAGYSASFSAIAFGNLQGMIINWTEVTKDAENKEYRVKHVVVYPFKDKDILTLASGKKYVFGVSLRRGTISTINTTIVNWGDDGIPNNANGIIVTGQ